MILPIYIYGHPVLRKEAQDIDVSYPNLKELIDNMYETMYNADGVGLAAPQVGLADRIFVIDLSPLADEENPQYKDLKKTFINAHIINRTGDMVSTDEG
ncbi:MAG: peptide deformylase, partial [Bacteroidales bacterium]|nr:peptide deformylase [Bacteroidales bacterium]